MRAKFEGLGTSGGEENLETLSPCGKSGFSRLRGMEP